MPSLSLKPSPRTWFTGLALGFTLSGAALAQNTNAAPPAEATATPAMATAPVLPAPDPEAEKALEQKFRAIYWALEGKSTVPDSQNFTENFNNQIKTEQLQQAFTQFHKNLGSCTLAGKLKSPVSFVGSYLLQCEKGFVPIDIAVEQAAPYRVHSLMIRPAYIKP